MKKSICFVFLVLLFLSVACSNDESASKDTDDTKESNKNLEDGAREDDKPSSSQDEKDKTSESAVTQTKEKEPTYEITKNWSIKPMTDDVSEKVVLLTIDDAPDKHALEMAKILKDLNAPAIFFVNGHFLNTQEKKEELKQIYEMGFEIGNHTYHHEALRWKENGEGVELPKEEQKEEIIGLNDLIEETIGERPQFFRAPHGMNTEYSEQIAADEGMALMNWSYGYDWNQEYQNAEAIADIMVNTKLLGDGSNLLMHDREWTKEALTDIVSGLREKGYEMVDPSFIKTSEK